MKNDSDVSIFNTNIKTLRHTGNADRENARKNFIRDKLPERIARIKST